MYNYGYAPAWHFMPPFSPYPQPRRRRRRETEYVDPMAQIEYWETALKKLKDSLKEKDKKDEKKPVSLMEGLMQFCGQLGAMMLIGFPVGLIVIKGYSMLLADIFK